MDGRSFLKAISGGSPKRDLKRDLIRAEAAEEPEEAEAVKADPLARLQQNGVQCNPYTYWKNYI